VKDLARIVDMTMADMPNRPTTRKWSNWQKLLAYATLSAISVFAVCYVDLKVHASASHNASK
jgi:hypothetical protein